MNQVYLKVNGQLYSGWTDISISAGIDRLSRDFNISITRTWPNAGNDIPIKNGDLVEVLIDDDKVMTGYVEALPCRYDAKSLSLGIVGRSKTADCIDCSAEPAQYSGASTVNIITSLAKPFNIGVIDMLNNDDELSVQADEGDTVFNVIEKIMGMQQIIAFDNANGQIVISPVGSEKATTALELGKNILSCDTERSIKDRYSDYFVTGQSVGDDDNFGESALAEVKATAKDPLIKRYRPFRINQSGDSDSYTCQERCMLEATVRASKTDEINYTVVGWRQADGRLWSPNMMVTITDPINQLYQKERVIAEVNYRLSSSGIFCELRVGPVEAYLPERKQSSSESGEVF